MIANVIFVIICAGIIIFLAFAPDETTSKLPLDENHNRFHAIKSKKAAEVFCVECHSPSKEAPLPDGHPPKFRCLFCHKRS